MPIRGDYAGHEFMGIVEDVGEDVTTIKKGDRVVACFDIACGHCGQCNNKLFSECDVTNSSDAQEDLYGHRTAGLFGFSHMTGGYAGGQADFARVPFGMCTPPPPPPHPPPHTHTQDGPLCPKAACALGLFCLME